MSYVILGFKAILVLLFLAHTAGLISRWYISGHAPWSDAYESMIYVAWATQFFGLVFGRKSALTMAATAFVAGMILYLGEIILGGQCPWNINVWENIVKGESLTIEIWGIHEKGE